MRPLLSAGEITPLSRVRRVGAAARAVAGVAGRPVLWALRRSGWKVRVDGGPLKCGRRKRIRERGGREHTHTFERGTPSTP